MLFSMPSLCALFFYLAILRSPLAVHLAWKDCKAPKTGSYRHAHPWQCHSSLLYQDVNLFIGAEEGWGVTQLTHRRKQYLKIGCSGLMASTPGKTRSHAGPMLFTTTGELFLRRLTEIVTFPTLFLNTSSLSNSKAAVAAWPPWDSGMGKLMLDCWHLFLIPDDRGHLRRCTSVTKHDEPQSLIATNTPACC